MGIGIRSMVRSPRGEAGSCPMGTMGFSNVLITVSLVEKSDSTYGLVSGIADGVRLHGRHERHVPRLDCTLFVAHS